MKINSLDLTHFRNYHHFFIEFHDDINIFIGDNGQGKTNLIEAIYLLSLGRSFKTHMNKQMIQFNEEYSKVKGNIISNERYRNLEIILGYQFKKAKVDHQDILKMSDYVGYLNVVTFIPDDLMLIKGSPILRRKFIDLEMSKISPIYIFNLNKYYKLLKERNKYLKILNKNHHRYDEYIEVLDEQLAHLQYDLIKRRLIFVEKLNMKVKDVYSKMTHQKEIIDLKYDCFLKNKDINEKNILDIYKSSFKRDMKYINTNYGIHKDDLKIFLNQREAIQFASQGQQRSIVLALKVALIELIKDEIGEYPVLLLDDVLSELDDQRKSMLLSLLNKKIQTFITTTSIDGIDHKILNEAKKIYIKDGKEEI